MTFWPTLPDARERFIRQILAVVAQIGSGNERGNRAIGYLSVRVMCTHDAVHIANQDRFDLQRAKFAVTALCEVIAAGFNLNQGGEEEWMHSFIRAREVFSGFLVLLPIAGFLLLLVHVDQSPCAASTNLLNFDPAMRAGIWFVGFNRTNETAFDGLLWFVNMLLHSSPFAFEMISRA